MVNSRAFTCNRRYIYYRLMIQCLLREVTFVHTKWQFTTQYWLPRSLSTPDSWSMFIPVTEVQRSNQRDIVRHCELLLRPQDRPTSWAHATALYYSVVVSKLCVEGEREGFPRFETTRECWNVSHLISCLCLSMTHVRIYSELKYEHFVRVYFA